MKLEKREVTLNEYDSLKNGVERMYGGGGIRGKTPNAERAFLSYKRRYGRYVFRS